MSITELVNRIDPNDATVAVKLSVNPATVYRWRSGRKVPTPYMRKALAKLAGVSVADVAWERKD